MNDDRDIIDVNSSSSTEVEGLKAWGWVSYLLHLVVAVAAVLPGAQVSVLLLLIAVVIDLVKRDDARGTWQESHFSWRLRSVLWAIVLYAVTFPFFLLGLLIFNPAWVLISIWFLYRIVSGMIAMNKNRAIQP
ncbi:MULTISPECIES: DUF4870 family protein [Comamonas]|jgi:uncharacterized membrane protein|uniref:Uncharacterized protein n=1 Tax=Comamonas thiooxydans TaxID=363952 RepID=A0A7M1L793_9BURK|nr:MULTISPECIES: hypothetical protein [Comamonas]ACY31478.1 putative transmembrane protein [Comamonas thiooxydans]EFI63469.1 putative transmembrane protein [Comamonas thiooxydans]KKI14725.1 membrane protein [Comamonas thiooxydans]MBL5977301.1 hypothetical protein [Comamonas sp. NyZ500]MDH1254552.1 hypothetical protein [Comamonas thiooxydans]